MTNIETRAPQESAPPIKHSHKQNITPWCTACEVNAAALKEHLCELGAAGRIQVNIVTELINKHGLRGI